MVRSSRLEATIDKCVAWMIEVGLLWPLPQKFRYCPKLQSIHRWGDTVGSLRTLEASVRKT